MITADKAKRTAYRASGHWGDLTLADMLRENVKRHPTREALVDAPNRAAFSFGTPQRLNYNEFYTEVHRVASQFAAHGLQSGDVVFVQLPNICELVVTYFACAELGLIISPVPVVYREHELKSLAATAKPSAYVFGLTPTAQSDAKRTNDRSEQNLFAQMAKTVFDSSVLLFAFGDERLASMVGVSDLTHSAFDQQALDAALLSRTASADDIFTICWTSGTTGTPKGVPRSHNHWIAIGPITYHAAGLSDADVILNPFPLVNMAGIGGVIMGWLQTNGTLVLHQPFDLKVFLTQLHTEQPQFTLAPPAILNLMLADEALAQALEKTQLKSIASGSAPLSPTMIAGFHSRFNISVVNMFGSNEGVSLASAPDNVPDPSERATYFPTATRYRSLFGSEEPHITCRLVDVTSREVIEEDGVAGELEIIGPTVFDGYLNAPQQNAEAFTQDGYFQTGDLFEYVNERRLLKFIGRCKDLIIRGGVNISPEELDELISQHPLVKEACAFGVPDDILGERIGVAVVTNNKSELTREAIVEFCGERGVAKIKHPEHVYCVPELPRNAMNKVVRRSVLALTQSQRKDQ